MPIVPPRLDDRNFESLVEELLARIPAHTPEWTHARVGDPGRTLLELFAWLADTLLYRANLIPERQRLLFLRLLGVEMRGAVPATGLIELKIDTSSAALQNSALLRALSEIKAAVPFETQHEVSVVDASAEVYYKRLPSTDERKPLEALLPDLAKLYGLDPQKAKYYVTTQVFKDGKVESKGFDLVSQALDGCLWLAILARKAEHVQSLREDFGKGANGQTRFLSLGVAPTLEVPPLLAEIGERGKIPHVFELLGTPDSSGKPVYYPLSAVLDSTRGLTRRGVLHLLLPGHAIGVPSSDVKENPSAGLSGPPRLDDADRRSRLVAWVRLRPTASLSRLSLSYVGFNAVMCEQRKTSAGIVIGQSDGSADQYMKLPAGSVERSSFQLEVEESGLGFRSWGMIDDLVFAGRDDAVFQLDAEAGTLRFGDGIRGRIPAPGMRVRVASMRAGGGSAGNLPPGTLKAFSKAIPVDSLAVLPQLKVVQSMGTVGGQDAETLAEAERRIPLALRHRERAVTSDDFRILAAEAPGAVLGRVEVMPKFKPHQRKENVPGVISVMALPMISTYRPPNPRPDRPTLEAVFAYLDPRRTVGTELYVIGCEYIPLGLGVGITVREGYGRETVAEEVKDALFRYLWPLAPGGSQGQGWPLKRPIRDREIEVAVAQVEGVEGIAGVQLFTRGVISSSGSYPGQGVAAARFEVDPSTAASGDKMLLWRALSRGTPGMAVEIVPRPWQLPELLEVVVDTYGRIPSRIPGGSEGEGSGGVGGVGGAGDMVAIPVVPEVC